MLVVKRRMVTFVLSYVSNFIFIQVRSTMDNRHSGERPYNFFTGIEMTINFLDRNFQFCTHGIVIYIFLIYQKSKFFSLLKKLLLSSLWFNHIYFLVHLQTQYKKPIGLLIILKSR